MKTDAERMARRFNDDGHNFTANGVTLDDACRSAGARREWRNGPGTDTYRWRFADGSVITIAGAAWDLGFSDCYCWQGGGHSDECENRRKDR